MKKITLTLSSGDYSGSPVEFYIEDGAFEWMPEIATAIDEADFIQDIAHPIANEVAGLFPPARLLKMIHTDKGYEALLLTAPGSYEYKIFPAVKRIPGEKCRLEEVELLPTAIDSVVSGMIKSLHQKVRMEVFIPPSNSEPGLEVKFPTAILDEAHLHLKSTEIHTETARKITRLAEDAKEKMFFARQSLAHYIELIEKDSPASAPKVTQQYAQTVKLEAATLQTLLQAENQRIDQLADQAQYELADAKRRTDLLVKPSITVQRNQYLLWALHEAAREWLTLVLEKHYSAPKQLEMEKDKFNACFAGLIVVNAQHQLTPLDELYKRHAFESPEYMADLINACINCCLVQSKKAAQIIEQKITALQTQTNFISISPINFIWSEHRFTWAKELWEAENIYQAQVDAIIKQANLAFANSDLLSQITQQNRTLESKYKDFTRLTRAFRDKYKATCQLLNAEREHVSALDDLIQERIAFVGSQSISPSLAAAIKGKILILADILKTAVTNKKEIYDTKIDEIKTIFLTAEREDALPNPNEMRDILRPLLTESDEIIHYWLEQIECLCRIAQISAQICTATSEVSSLSQTVPTDAVRLEPILPAEEGIISKLSDQEISVDSIYQEQEARLRLLNLQKESIPQLLRHQQTLAEAERLRAAIPSSPLPDATPHPSGTSQAARAALSYIMIELMNVEKWHAQLLFGRGGTQISYQKTQTTIPGSIAILIETANQAAYAQWRTDPDQALALSKALSDLARNITAHTSTTTRLFTRSGETRKFLELVRDMHPQAEAASAPTLTLKSDPA